MTSIAQSAVLVPSSADIHLEGLDYHMSVDRSRAPPLAVAGPKGDFADVEATLACYPTVGFQGSHFGKAIEISRRMITHQPPSTVFAIQNGEFVKVVAEAEHNSTEEGNAQSGDEPAGEDLVYPDIFLGITATLMGTGCREAVRFLVREGVAPRPNAAAVAKNLSTNEMSFAQLKREYAGFAARVLNQRQADEEEGNKSSQGNGGDAEQEDAVADMAPLGECRSFLSAVVMSGGGPEHDIRRACQSYRLGAYASEEVSCGARGAVAGAKEARFGNIFYADATAAPTSRRRGRGHGRGGPQGRAADKASPRTTCLFDAFMRSLAQLLHARQAKLRAAHQARPEQERRNALLDGTAYCEWSTTPSEVWALAGLWMVDIFEYLLRNDMMAPQRRSEPKRGHHSKSKGARSGSRADDREREIEAGETRDDATITAKASLSAGTVRALRAEAVRYAESTVLYWAARQEVPIFCPSFADGDVARYLLEHAAASPKGKLTEATSAMETAKTPFKLDLVRDIHGINKLAMYSKCTGMLICGGGSVKHHVCNANLMRNGADYTVFISNGQEFDGSDAGARPEEAVSWGKIRCDGEAVKVYSEVSVVLPLLVAQVFVPAVRERWQAAASAQ